MSERKEPITARVAPELADYLDGLANGSTRSAVIERIVREHRAAASQEPVADGPVAAAEFERVLQAIRVCDTNSVWPFGQPRPPFSRWLVFESRRLGVDSTWRDPTPEEESGVRAELGY
jgi:hypothetical protein